MSHENVDRLRGVYNEWAKGELQAGEELYAEGATFVPMAEGRETLDRDGFRRFMHSFLSEWDDFTCEAVDIADHGDKVLVTEHQRATGRGSGIAIDQLFYVVWTFEGGLAVHVRWDSDPDEARRAAGLSG
ncbi:MAG TPA: nuclear transport factor 2 family protein [Solirubrobacterales bacterium]|nr:nuclear transport factor 2 family protein [Solirubrobacterales bacterium]